MKIGIDGYEANIGERVGIGRYAFEIMHHMYRLAQNHSVTIFLPSPPKSDLPAPRENWRYVVTGPQKLWTFFGLPLAITKSSLDVFFSPTHYIPRFVSVPRVMSIMDMSFLSYPELFRVKDRYQLIKWTAYSALRARRILTISQFSRNAIINAYGISPKNVIVTYPGLTKLSMTNANHLIDGSYILSVGTLQPRKNYIRLIEAFSRLHDEKLRLVIVGKKGWLYEDILSAPMRFGISDRVRFMDFVEDAQLTALYQKASCLALVSLYEGFGLPVLEAMSYGIPVVVSRVSSLPEIAGDAGIYVNPEDTDDIAEGLRIGLKPQTAKQKALANAQVAKFSWEQAAKKTLEVLEHI